MTSSWQMVIRGIHQGLIQGLILFNICINGLMEKNAISVNMKVNPNWGQWMICWKVGLLFRKTLEAEV